MDPDATPITRHYTTQSDDLEIASIEVILTVLRDLGDVTRRRVLNYVTDRVESERGVS